jgi:diguanylate cyclase (GGDEF)-like protein/PAS domain S-box-containing protein
MFSGEGNRGPTDVRGTRTTPDAALMAPDLPGMLTRVPVILYIADVGGEARWSYASPQIEAILGFTPEEWCAEPRAWAQQLHPVDRERVLKVEADALAGDPLPTPLEYRMLHRDGHAVWILDEAALVPDDTGHVRWHGVMSDITARKQVEAELEQRAAQQAAVARLGEHALEGMATSQLMQEAVAALAEILDVDLTAVIELVPDSGALVLRAGFGWPESMIGSLRFGLGTGSQAGYTILTDAPVVVKDWEQEQRFEMPASLRETGARSGMCVPIEGRDGRFGVLGVQSTRLHEFKAGDVDFAQSIANVLADALARQATEDDIRHRALHDALTGLPNRVLFLDRIEQALARKRQRSLLTVVLFLDLDHFKLVNDSLGHQHGDELLAAAAPRIKQVVRTSDTVARFGGDEFGVLLEDISDVRRATEMAERIGSVFTRPFVLAGREHFVTASIGIAFAEANESAAELIRDADAAMYRAKEQGRARYELFDEVMRARAVARLRVENDLRRAIEREELLLHYQPLVALHDDGIIAVEALVRWQHPERGLVAPLDFIPVAEENGLIEPIGRWVLERACAQAAKWYHARPDAPPISISVNLSPVQLANPRFPDVVAEALERTRLDPACLYLELTESSMLHEDEALADVLQKLKRLGVRLLLDDFGTGYSSLGYLTHLPLDALKVDRSFVDGLGVQPRDTAITEAIIAMSKALSLDVIAEGVESARQADELRRLGCDIAQGYWFSRPVSADAITALLQRYAALPACSGDTVALPHS